MKSTVSIIIPVYNVEKYIDRCIKSVINQTYEKLEIILIDDGSPDNCPEICDKWSQTDSRIKVIHKKNGGLSDARNAGLSIATGKYVLFVDSDDWISNNMVENMVQAMENNDVDIVICQYIVAYENGEEKNLKTEVGERIFDSKEALRLLLQNTIITNHVWRKLYKRNLIKPNIFPVNRNYEDIYTVADFFISCNKIMYLDDAYYYYFQNDMGITKTFVIKNCNDYLNANKYRNKVILKKYPELKKDIKKSMKETKKIIHRNYIITILKKMHLYEGLEKKYKLLKNRNKS